MATQIFSRTFLNKPTAIFSFLSRSFTSLPKTPTPPPVVYRSFFHSLRPLAAASQFSFSTPSLSFSTRSTTSLNDRSPNWSNRPPKETILLDGCDFNHWLVVVEQPEGVKGENKHRHIQFGGTAQQEMRRTLGITLRSIGRSHTTLFSKPLSTFTPPGDNRIDNKTTSNTFESNDHFYPRIFGGCISGNNAASEAFYRKLDKVEKAHDYFDTLSDGLEGKLKQAATKFKFDPQDISKGDSDIKPYMRFRPGMTNNTKDFGPSRPGERRPFRRPEFKVTTKEVLRKADFRNVRFLANFITEAGILHKRSKMGISAKAQRKIAREIKTARAFGLMPFTTMGTRSFVFGKTMENLDDDYAYDRFRRGRSVVDVVDNAVDDTVDDVIEKEPLEA